MNPIRKYRELDDTLKQFFRDMVLGSIGCTAVFVTAGLLYAYLPTVMGVLLTGAVYGLVASFVGLGYALLRGAFRDDADNFPY